MECQSGRIWHLQPASSPFSSTPKVDIVSLMLSMSQRIVNKLISQN
jgi:hypothetical protein